MHTVYLKISVFYQVNFSTEPKNYYHYNEYYNWDSNFEKAGAFGSAFITMSLNNLI